eukprot:755035-Hanusia_phi.AAC.1
MASSVAASPSPSYALSSSVLLFIPFAMTFKDPLSTPSHLGYVSIPAVNRLTSRTSEGIACARTRTLVDSRAREARRTLKLQPSLRMKEEISGITSCPDSLMNLLVQRAVQNKLHFLVSVQNEPVASWIENFLDHKHLKMIKMTDYHCKACYHGIDGLTCNWSEYLEELEGTSEQTIHVQYTPGVSEYNSLRNDNYSYTNVFGQEPPWAQASASRRQNPFLKENNGMPKIEFTEVTVLERVLL